MTGLSEFWTDAERIEFLRTENKRLTADNELLKAECAAMEAVRHPTDAMWKAGCTSISLEPGQKSLSPSDCETVFEAMMNAALENDK